MECRIQFVFHNMCMSDLYTKGDKPRYDLLPVGVFRMGTRGEAHSLVCACERDIEPRQESMDV